MAGKPVHKYKLHYFDVKGAGEALRLMFAFKKIDFDDTRYTREEWETVKEEMPNKMMPCLEIDGKKYGQSYALLRYLGREFDLYGSNNLERLVIDEVGETFVDMYKGVGPIFAEQDPEKKVALMRTMIDETLPKFVPFICNRLNENGTGYLVGNSFSIGDLIVYRNIEFLGDFISASITDYDKFLGRPELQKHFEMVESIPEIKAWIAKRPKSIM